MYQDTHFSQEEDFSNVPQLPFPEPTQLGVLETGTLKHLFPAQTQPDITPIAPDHDYTKTTDPRQFPSTETIDTSQIPPLQQLPPDILLEETTQPPIAQHKPAVQPAQSFPPQANVQQQMPGMVSVPVVTQTMPVTKSTAQQPARSERAPSNQDAKRAIINGVISFIVSSFTLLTIAGFAGLVIGTFAILYGLMGLRLASRLPNKAGRGQALIGIALGLIAWCIVIAASIFRAPLSS